jgi:methylthioribose-1-phosphate isomerase
MSVWQIRGAPAIASLAALSVSQHLTRALRADPPPDFLSSPESLVSHVTPILDFLITARPTAVNLGAATRRLSRTLQSSLRAGKDARAIAEDLAEDGKQVAAEDVGRNKAMAKWGGDWLVEKVKGGGGSGDGLNVLTVCNTGSLATSVRTSLFLLYDYAAILIPSGRDMVPPLDLSPIYTKRGSLKWHIIRRQHHITRAPGAETTLLASYSMLINIALIHSRLTALELKTLQIPSTMIVDTMVGSLFQHHKIHAVGLS